MVALLLLAGCATTSGARPSPATSAETPLAVVRARYEGAQMGLGFGCVVEDPPPHGGWTVVFTVVDPGTSGLAAGSFLCAVVHSPSMYAGDVVGSDGNAACRVVPGVSPPLFRCGEGPAPTADMPVFDRAWAEALERRAAP